MADYLVRLEGIVLAISMGRDRNALILSIRTTRHDLNAGEIMKKLVAGQGSAGGHGMMAGGRISPVFPSVEAFHQLEQSLIQRLLAELGASPCEPKPLIDG
jgi:nanoRNase/pAp phosphatase (c-di-AMP/oligoRNAs hydrolase)